MCTSPFFGCAAVFSILIFSGEAWCQQITREPIPPLPLPGQKSANPLRPLVYDSLETALQQAAKREQPVVLAVGLDLEGDIPALFRESRLARMSRMAASFTFREYASEDVFFLSRGIAPDQVPAVFLLDHRGNLIDRRPADVDPSILLSAIRNARLVSQSLEKEMPAILKKAEDRARIGERALLEFARPWLARHYQGFPELIRLRELVVEFGSRRLAMASDLEPWLALSALEGIARAYVDTPIQAQAALGVARLHRSLGRTELVREKLRSLLTTMPWPENRESHDAALALLAELRLEEIERRRRQLDRQPFSHP